jgi:hypothetical protein
VSGLSKVGNADVGFCHVTETDRAACVSFEVAIPYATRSRHGRLATECKARPPPRVAKYGETEPGGP